MSRVDLVLLCLAATACSNGWRFETGAIELTLPPGSGEPSLYATSAGDAVLTWHEPMDDGRSALRLAVRAGGTWTTPVTVIERDNFFVNWADFPSFVELEDGTWVVHWLETVASTSYAYHVKLAMSRDRGASWSAPIVPHRDDSPQEHGFVSMVALPGGGMALVWLDGRNMAAAHGEHGGDMSIRTTTVGADGSLGEEVLLDDRTCECCQTALVQTPSGLVAAYRDRSPEEVRDIAIVRQVNGVWTEPTHVADDHFVYPGCPVNGPQLAATGDTVSIAWYAAPEGATRVQVAFSLDGGETFGAPVRVDLGDPLGRVDIETLPDGSALAVWVERTEAAAAILARRVRPDGRMDAEWQVSPTAEARASGFPRMVRLGDEIVIAYRLVGEDGGVRVRTVRRAG
ncbi:MAG: glycoside hydrolase [Gemmatimonadota bacterium]|nr:glycoside hydrolase [Gemmatimonadota bacterium]MDH3479623.1 glycoside hydrolase [Gemmatimonadota bacterium]MDH3570416.1 glycoside hydrolase [Gemmatimonadota bacterium]MDH5549484.1 glycoside hydrolase [Gemmatimonadota bacterium]